MQVELTRRRVEMMQNGDVLIFGVGCAVFAVPPTSTFIYPLVSDKSDE